MVNALKLIIMSDSHGDFRSADMVVQRHKEEKCIFLHLGDGIREIEELRMLYPEIDLRSVAGNCDFSSSDPITEEICFADKTVVFTHGHEYNVKFTDKEILAMATSRGASLVVHGHTHIPREKYIDGLYLLCPGSVSRNLIGSSSYAVVEVGKEGILINIMKV